jgi:hypothetical protein
MNGIRDTNDTATAGEGGSFDPQQAAALLDQTRRQTRRQLEIGPPLLWLIRAAVTFLGYGALWWSVRDQHPYAGPSPAAIVIVYTLVGVALGATVRYSARATAGVGGRSQVLRRAERLTLVVVYIAVYTFMGALQHAGASHAIVYGIYPAVAQLIFIAGVGAAMAAARANWPLVTALLAIVAVGAGAAFAGPAGAWLAAGLGLTVVLLAYTVWVWLRRA